MRPSIFLFALFLGSLLACNHEKDMLEPEPNNGLDDRWILVETVNAWTGEVTSYTAENSPEAFDFRADSTFTKYRIAENCSIQGAYRERTGEPGSIDLTYLEDSTDCPVYFGYPPYLILENGQLVHDARPWDGERLVYSRQ